MYFTYYVLGIILLPAIILGIYAQIKVHANYDKYSKVLTEKGVTGKEVAKLILDASNITDVQVIEVSGKLSDYYDDKNKTLALSSQNYNSSSIASLGVTAHECGHAIQNKEGLFINKLRNVIIKVYNISSKLLLPILIIGLIFNFLLLIPYVANIVILSGITVFGLSLLFNLITLPVEFDASNKALKILKESELLNKEELKGAKKVLRSAALTYVAEFIYSLLNFLRFVLIFVNHRRD